MVIHSVDVNKDYFHSQEDNEELIGLEVSYLNAIGVLMYLANSTQPDIVFSVNLLARFSSTLTRKHWNGVKHILYYFRGTTDIGLYYSKESKSEIVIYADVDYLSDPHKPRSQIDMYLPVVVQLYHKKSTK